MTPTWRVGRHIARAGLLAVLLGAAVLVPAAVTWCVAVAADPAASGSARANVVVLFEPWRDPTERAFTVSVPKGWKVTGGTTRKSSVDVRHHVRAVSSGGAVEVTLGDGSLIPNQAPSSLTTMVGYREGQRMRAAWGGEVLVARYLTGEQYAHGYALKRFCRSQGTATATRLEQATRFAERGREQARSRQVDVMSGWVARNKKMDAVMQRGSDARRGTTTVEDPVLGSRTIGNDSSYYWTRPDGSIVGTNTDTPPDYSSGWRMMTRH